MKNNPESGGEGKSGRGEWLANGVAFKLEGVRETT